MRSKMPALPRRNLDRVRHRFALAAALALSAASCHAAGEQEQRGLVEEARPALGLMTSLPIFWGEPADMGSLLDGSNGQHWVRTKLEERYTLLPLDVLGDADGQPQADLAQLERLFVAQPRALTAADNVALDAWVRGGGQLLLVLDPMMTDHSVYPIGDKRRFNDVALVPPVLKRWGLALQFPATAEPVEIAFEGVAVPVADHGMLSVAAQSPSSVQCELAAKALIARCRVGRGEVLVVADAAFLNQDGDRQASSRAADAILGAAFD